MDEITQFAQSSGATEEEGEEGGDNEAMNLSALAGPLLSAQASKVEFHRGDHVEVVEGSLRGMTGTLKEIRASGDTAIVELYLGKGIKATEVPVRELRKRFRQGDHIRVIHGRYQGETGMVVHVAGAVITVLSDASTKESFQVFSKDVREAREAAGGGGSTGSAGELGGPTSGPIGGSVSLDRSSHRPSPLAAYQVHDFCELVDKETVGVVIRMEGRDGLALLCQDGSVRSVKAHQLLGANRPGSRKRDHSRAVASDHSGNILRVSDRVKEVHTPNREGTILFLHRGTAFVKSREVVENAGVFVSRSKDLASSNPMASAMAAGGPLGAPGSINSPRSIMGGPGAGGPGRLGGGGGRRGPKDRLVGQTVMVRQGKHKGKLGIVKEVTGDLARVEIHTDAQIVTLPKAKLNVRLYGLFRVPLCIGEGGG